MAKAWMWKSVGHFWEGQAAGAMELHEYVNEGAAAGKEGWDWTVMRLKDHTEDFGLQ